MTDLLGIDDERAGVERTTLRFLVDERSWDDIHAERDALRTEADRWRTTADLMHHVNVEMLARQGIEWTPGEPFVAVVEAEIKRLRAAARDMRAAQKRYFKERTQAALAESKRLEKQLDDMLAGHTETSGDAPGHADSA